MDPSGSVLFEEKSKKYPYHTFLSSDAKPPLGMDEELMGKYRPLMEKYYLNLDQYLTLLPLK